MSRHLKRLERERRTVRVMIELFCRDTHHSTGGPCDQCRQLFDYAMERIARCPYEHDKPTCARCPVHCYEPVRRNQVRQVMRLAGPRMMRAHPLLTVLHYLDEITGPRPDSPGKRLKGSRKRLKGSRERAV